MIETPLKEGKKHGREYTWNDEGSLESIEPYFEGKLHGLSRQYGRKGNVIGTYRCVYGTGLDIWRQEKEDGTVFVSEIHSLKDGLPHGYEWWLEVDQHTVWQERHWREGLLHGIERVWNNKSKLHRGYPKFWIQDQAVTKRKYLKTVEVDKTLPPFRVEDNHPQRQFPTVIKSLFVK
jgi:antitoxin component YwqK of YwqJK toxin-antitoxin module